MASIWLKVWLGGARPFDPAKGKPDIMGHPTWPLRGRAAERAMPEMAPCNGPEGDAGTVRDPPLSPAWSEHRSQ